ncbi:MAG: protein kinase, partial [Phycisphaeraceae bacterium]|nr:protein kinase [Phycisphaeraceae bacterium]
MGFVAERVASFDCSHCGQTIHPADQKPLAKTVCPACRAEVTVPARFDNIVLVGQIGRGGSGVVFHGRDERLGREVAIKVLRSGDADAEKIALACVDEARALAALNDPNIVHIYRIGEYKKQHFIEMELVTGGTAEQFLVRENPLGEQRALRLVMDVARGLEAASRVGLLHMDVKPGNILITDDGKPKLIDFGEARHGDDSAGKNTVVGTPYYIAPEVARGRAPDVQADIYSLGATLYHLLTGSPPFPGTSRREVIEKRFHEPVPEVGLHREVSEATEWVVATMLARDPAQRFSSYSQLIAALERAIQMDRQLTSLPHDEMLDSLATSAAPRVRMRRKNRGRSWGALAAILLVAAGVGLYFLFADRQPSADSDPVARAPEKPEPMPAKNTQSPQAPSESSEPTGPDPAVEPEGSEQPVPAPLTPAVAENLQVAVVKPEPPAPTVKPLAPEPAPGVPTPEPAPKVSTPSPTPDPTPTPEPDPKSDPIQSTRQKVVFDKEIAAYWPLNRDVIKDLVGGDRPRRLGEPLFVEDPAFGRVLYFNGADQALLTGDYPKLQDRGMVSAW